MVFQNFRVCIALSKSKLKGVHHYVDLELDGIGMALSQSAIDRDPQAVEDKTVHFSERLVDNDTKVREFMFSELKSSGKSLHSLSSFRSGLTRSP